MFHVFIAIFELKLGRGAIACKVAIVEKEPQLGMQLYFASSELLLLRASINEVLSISSNLASIDFASW